MRKRIMFWALASGLLACAAAPATAAETAAAAVAEPAVAKSPVQTVGDDLVGALKAGKIKGTLGSFMEGAKFDEEQGSRGDSYSWGTGYLQLAYTTSQYKGFTMGMEFLGHFELWSSDETRVSYFNVDIEDGSEFSMPQFWLKYNFTEKSEVVVGRWEHLKFTHIDDVQAEGAYFRTHDLVKNVDFTFGVVTAFAELDYDDAEDWDKESQNLDEDKYYGEDASDMLLFSELKWKAAQFLTVNPFFYYQQDYAGAYGLDLDGHVKIKDDLTLGTRTASVWIDAQDRTYHGKTTPQGDAFTWSITPYTEIGTEVGVFTLEAGYASFDGADHALNKPAWLRDYIIDVLDQDRVYAMDDCDVVFGRLKWKRGDFWSHYAVGYYHDIDLGAENDGRVTENEIQFGYDITKNIDVNLRLFDVDYNYESKGNSQDYQKFEFRCRLKF